MKKKYRYRKLQLKGKPKDQYLVYRPDIIWDAYLVFAGLYQFHKSNRGLPPNKYYKFAEHLQETFSFGIKLPEEQYLSDGHSRVNVGKAVTSSPYGGQREADKKLFREKKKVKEGLIWAVAQDYTVQYIEDVTKELKKHARCQSDRIKKSYLKDSRTIQKGLYGKVDSRRGV